MCPLITSNTVSITLITKLCAEVGDGSTLLDHTIELSSSQASSELISNSSTSSFETVRDELHLTTVEQQTIVISDIDNATEQIIPSSVSEVVYVTGKVPYEKLYQTADHERITHTPTLADRAQVTSYPQAVVPSKSISKEWKANGVGESSDPHVDSMHVLKKTTIVSIYVAMF